MLTSIDPMSMTMCQDANNVKSMVEAWLWLRWTMQWADSVLQMNELCFVKICSSCRWVYVSHCLLHGLPQNWTHWLWTIWFTPLVALRNKEKSWTVECSGTIVYVFLFFMTKRIIWKVFINSFVYKYTNMIMNLWLINWTNQV